jgi:hypothetical protein
VHHFLIPLLVVSIAGCAPSRSWSDAETERMMDAMSDHGSVSVPPMRLAVERASLSEQGELAFTGQVSVQDEVPFHPACPYVEIWRAGRAGSTMQLSSDVTGRVEVSLSGVLPSDSIAFSSIRGAPIRVSVSNLLTAPVEPVGPPGDPCPPPR